ncbi:sodium:calcium symporter [candidate division WOR-1 bacterium RIFOXYA12_FULL_52_29]|uniref:Sodium:calcium symporter n=1 Tax=candidate division WOR-1 bacterium RIFOXYC12_FULL_54_18 TaxID=1802584 RepID=A0A1F4T5P3_UNCSA|nr:MAG: sodium:calcium symporter [candidate division WOR-1 bacterium RIFOXYA2_FULL_51_19]OGC17665.1 MAG: sodium:calcium symporter [candidate division WOR-1 bacterium RIFOXYA12_FULL_52_29]OGC26522.1 MAG: sodium:calcium symporter [candidate division WOR-1 bacterium RIFOXYB2_FULL_45_9]OGC28082.1 MAG: sodium:calcium symporter [candidate division WOR-1 bacterium RIFOXYC12_FULL_54_18]OGC29632.1 MAG: sodium:calcium symporter [candidate division WOR-1 bacterium RIFOXYB12_FULL_52_16]
MAEARQKWGTKLGIILAVAGSAVGLGNFLRFPVQAAQNGGGAFLIPYFISFVLLGIPLMWIEWAIGRHGGLFGHGSAPLILNRLWKNRLAKYLGVVGVFGPIVIFLYYTYIESWLLGYAFFSLTGQLFKAITPEAMKGFLSAYQGLAPGSNLATAYLFFFVTFLINFYFIYRGIQGGIELLCKIAMPILFFFGFILAARVLMIPNIIDGLGFLWNPDFSVLTSAKVWMAAAGQIFFTLSVGIGVILTYASYLKKGDDVALSGLTAASTNELAEVVLGGTIVIPAAFVFFGAAGATAAAASGAFNLGFVTMPLIFGQIDFGGFFALLWFALLFLAGITSSVSLLAPAVAFFSDDFGLTRKKAVLWLGGILFILCQFPVFFLGRGVVDELDFWGGTFSLVLFGTIETIIFVWFFGIEKAWDEIHSGAEMRIPGFYKPIIRYVTPVFLLLILGFWFFQQGLPVIMMQGVAEANKPYVLATRIGLILLFISIALAVRIAYYRKKRAGELE